MASDFVKLAAEAGCTYSRYADDLTFSTNKKEFPADTSCRVTRFAHDGKLRAVVYHVYTLVSANGVLYTGVTNGLERRVTQHRRELLAGFTKRYGVKRLVYFEGFSDVRDAISREKQIKGWRREKRLALIRKTNPKFRDLSEDFSG